LWGHGRSGWGRTIAAGDVRKCSGDPLLATPTLLHLLSRVDLVLDAEDRGGGVP